MSRYLLKAAPKGWPEELEFRLALADGSCGIGDEFEADLTDEEEAENLKSGVIELVEPRYRVAGESVVDGHEPGEEFEGGLTLAREALLVEGGHVERVEKPAEKKAPKKATTRTKKREED